MCMSVCVSERLTDHSLPDRAPSVAWCTLDHSSGAKVPARCQPGPNSNTDRQPTRMLEGRTEGGRERRSDRWAEKSGSSLLHPSLIPSYFCLNAERHVPPPSFLLALLILYLPVSPSVTPV